jgi:hypothetical protein
MFPMNRSKIVALITSLVGVILAVGDYTDVIDDAAAAFNIPPKNVPLIYIGLFTIAWLLQRHYYESAAYDFCTDARSEYLSEMGDEQSYVAETYRLCVLNNGYRPISVQVKLINIAPLPVELTAKLGMPLIPMGATESKPVQINPGERRPFNLFSAFFPLRGDTYSLEYLRLWHDWVGVPRDINPNKYTFDLLLTPAEGLPKVVRYGMDSASPGSGRAYVVSRELKPSRLDRIEKWLESTPGG